MKKHDINAFAFEGVSPFELLLKKILTLDKHMRLSCKKCGRKLHFQNFHAAFALEDLDRTGVLPVGYDGLRAVPGAEERFGSAADYVQGFVLHGNCNIDAEVYDLYDPNLDYGYTKEEYLVIHAEQLEEEYEEKTSFGYAGTSTKQEREKADCMWQKEYDADDGLYCVGCKDHIGSVPLHRFPIFLFAQKVNWEVSAPGLRFIIEAELQRSKDTKRRNDEMTNTRPDRYIPRY